MKVLDLEGNHYEMGFQHGRRVNQMKGRILLAMNNRLRMLERLHVDFLPYQVELAAVWEAIDRPTLDMMKGIADALGLDWKEYFRYTIASYLADSAKRPIAGQGCTSWAASGTLTCDHTVILAKNRDYRPDHRSLQCLVKARPLKGYRCTYLTSAGSPGVFSSGMNEKGLAVADTHVVSTDTGPGLARYSVMMNVLEEFSSVSDALDYLQSIKHIGDGSLTLADADGDMAVFEAGHTEQAVIRPEGDCVVSTNHYRSAGLQKKWLDLSPANLRGNTFRRYAMINRALKTCVGEVDIPWARKLMASHLSPQEAICRHPEYEPASVTISTVLFMPKTKTLLFTDGMPCKSSFFGYKVNQL